MDIVIHLADVEVAALTAELTTVDQFQQPVIPDLTVLLPDLIRHRIVQPIQDRQSQYAQATRIQQLLTASPDVLSKIDKTLATGVLEAMPPVRTPPSQ